MTNQEFITANKVQLNDLSVSDQNLVLTLIQELLDLAKVGTRTERADKLMRKISNYATCGRSGNSASMKMHNKNISEGALLILIEEGIEVFSTKRTVNEHPKPLTQTWNWLTANATTLTVEDGWTEFSNNPMITVAKEEDNMMNKSGQKSTGNFQTRYTDLGIEVFVLDAAPKNSI